MHIHVCIYIYIHIYMCVCVRTAISYEHMHFFQHMWREAEQVNGQDASSSNNPLSEGLPGCRSQAGDCAQRLGRSRAEDAKKGGQREQEAKKGLLRLGVGWGSSPRLFIRKQFLKVSMGLRFNQDPLRITSVCELGFWDSGKRLEGLVGYG